MRLKRAPEQPHHGSTERWLVSYADFVTLLFAFFVVKMILFFVVFGSFYSDMITFTGILGFSVAINGGECQPVVSEESKKVQVINKFRLAGLGRHA